MNTPGLLRVVFLCSAAGLASLPAQNLLTNGDFENGTTGWGIFAPGEAQQSDPQLQAVEGGREGQAGQMSCSDPVRFGIANYLKKGTFTPSQRLRVSAWIKAGEGFEAVPGTPGFVVRVSMFADGEEAGGGLIGAQEGLFYVGLHGVTVRGADVSSMNDQGVPTEWTKVEGVFETSPDTAVMNVSVFIWSGSGKLLVDDVVIEPVDESVPLSEATTN
jgi:hypothetical protein